MADNKNQTRMLMLMTVLALWLAAFGYSLLLLLTTGAEISGFGPGVNPITNFLGWQGVAAVLAFGCWGIGWSFARGSGIRRVSAVPLVLALVAILGIIGLAVVGP